MVILLLLVHCISYFHAIVASREAAKSAKSV